MANDPTQEPTMDDILASIRKIISEDEGGKSNSPATSGQDNVPQNHMVQQQNPNSANTQPSPAMDEEEPLVLPKAGTNPVNQFQVNSPQPASASLDAMRDQQRARGSAVFSDDSPLPRAIPKRKAPSLDGLGLDNLTEVARPAMRSSTAQRNDRMGGDSAFSDERILSAATETLGTASFASLERAVRMGKAGDTLEDVVRNLLRPMLRSWIDQNLPSLVERMVQMEIQKIVSGARRNWDDSDNL